MRSVQNIVSQHARDSQIVACDSDRTAVRYLYAGSPAELVWALIDLDILSSSTE